MMFKYHLAKTLRLPVAELEQRLTYKEFRRWAVFLRLEAEERAKSGGGMTSLPGEEDEL
jgi:hypothetical protein